MRSSRTSPQQASALLRNRQQNGDFKNYDGLKKVPGIEGKALA